jgi:hypothetical protein
MQVKLAGTIPVPSGIASSIGKVKPEIRETKTRETQVVRTCRHRRASAQPETDGDLTDRRERYSISQAARSTIIAERKDVDSFEHLVHRLRDFVVTRELAPLSALSGWLLLR